MFFKLHFAGLIYDDGDKILLDESESVNEDDDEVGNLFLFFLTMS